MTNMSYCRFENTLGDLKDCWDNINDIEDASEYEIKARYDLVKLCIEISNAFDGDPQQCLSPLEEDTDE